MRATANRLLAASGIAVLAALSLGPTAANADTNCVVTTFGPDRVAVHQTPSVDSPIVGYITVSVGGRGGCRYAGGGFYTDCGGGSVWVSVRQPALGWVPERCVDVAQ